MLCLLLTISLPSQKYEPHHDFFHDSVNQAPELGGQRVATILMYLYAPRSPQSYRLVLFDGKPACFTMCL